MWQLSLTENCYHSNQTSQKVQPLRSELWTDAKLGLGILWSQLSKNRRKKNRKWLLLSVTWNFFLTPPIRCRSYHRGNACSWRRRSNESCYSMPSALKLGDGSAMGDPPSGSRSAHLRPWCITCCSGRPCPTSSYRMDGALYGLLVVHEPKQVLKLPKEQPRDLHITTVSILGMLISSCLGRTLGIFKFVFTVSSVVQLDDVLGNPNINFPKDTRSLRLANSGLSQTPESYDFPTKLDSLIPWFDGMFLTFACMWLLKKKIFSNHYHRESVAEAHLLDWCVEDQLKRRFPGLLLWYNGEQQQEDLSRPMNETEFILQLPE